MTVTRARYDLASVTREGVYKLRAVVHDIHGADVELGPYYVDIGRENVSVFMNSSSIHDSEALSFADSLPQQKGTVVMHRFSSVSSYNVSFISQTQVDSSQAWLGVTVGYKMQSVSIYTNGTVFAADTNITFVAVTKETLPLEFMWYLGDDPPVRTTSRSIRRRLSIPQWYHVMVKATSRIGSVVSEPHLIRIQKRIIANRLMSTASALVNANVSFECRLNFGTDVAYLWNFGDGTIDLGKSFSSHVYRREGEFTVEVLAFNNVSSAILRKQLFIVHEPCQPPPVKNMGPKQVQIWRSQPLTLRVTFEAAVLCNISQGLSYTWSIVDAGATAVTLPAAVNTHRQTIMLPSYTLECGNYTAMAKVQIKGSMVYSNYCVGVEVRPRAPVSVISEGTHIFIPRATTTPIILRGFQSYDPDNPGAALSTVGLLGSSAFGALLKLSQSGLQSNPRGPLTLHSPQRSPMPLSWTTLPNLGSTSTESTAGGHHIPVVGPLAGSGEPMEDYGSLSPAPGSSDEQALMMSTPEGSWPPSSSSPAFDDFEAYYSDIQEDVPSLGRQPGSGTNFQESGPSMDAEESASDGDNLLGPFLHTGREKPAFMIDWPKTLVSRAVFHGYTSSGIVGPAVTIKPFSLSSGEMYVLQASAVIVSTEITDGQGSKVQPCTVEVTVLPRYHGNDCPDKDLYSSTLETLSSLQLVGSYTEIRNYIAMTTAILSRLYVESKNTSMCGLWSQIQDVLISSACKLPSTDQEAMMDSIHILRDLINFPNKLSWLSAMHILKYAQMFLRQGQFSRKLLVNKKLGIELILLISGVWEAAREDKRNGDYLQEEGLKIISDTLLACLSLSHQRQLHISTGQMEFWTVLHHSFQSSVQNLGFIWVHFPGDLALHSSALEESHSPCYISQLMVFMSSPYPAGQAPGQVGGVVSPRLYSCKSRRPILRGRLKTPVTVEFGEEDHRHKRNPTMYTLIRDEINLHQFIGLSEKPQETLQIQIEFSKPVTRAFPIMLLVRFSKKATPADFLVKQVYFWDEQTVQIYVPAVPVKGTNVGYLSLLDADYDRRPPNKYLAGAVNYTVNFQWIQCVFWDKTGWRSEGPCPHPGSSPEKVNCSYHRLAPFSILRRKLNATLEMSSISGFRSTPNQLGPLQKIRLWHDSSGPSPNWFISHVMVKELHSGQGWFFLAQCWLAVSLCDGRVQRELFCLRRGLGFWKLFYSKFTEYLEDFHIWLSLYSQPTSSSYLHAQRLAVSFCLLCVYSCLTALVTVGVHEQVLAARQRERHLRWAQLASRAKFRVTKERLKKESQLQAALRNARYSFGKPSSTDDWWDWTVSTLLNGLYPEGPAAGAWGAQPGALGGQCHLIGPSVIKQLKVSSGTACTPPRPVSELMEDALSTSTRDLDLENPNVTHGGPEACGVKKENSMHSLGRTRHEVHSALTALRANRWIDHSTRAMSVHFTLYNPPMRLFTSVTLGAEFLPMGGLVPSSLVESFSIFYSDSVPQYLLMLSELVFLVLNMTHLCFQLWGMATNGVLSYWKKPRHWLELSMIGVALAYYAASGHLTTLAKNVNDQVHKGLHQMSVDLSLMVSWNQLLGALLLAAHSHLYRFLLVTWTPSSSTSTDAFPRLLLQFLGRSQRDSLNNHVEPDHQAMACYRGALFLLVATLCFRMVRRYLDAA
ncbi:Polycystic kidney disease protein 1-like 1 [Cricetulus griseus]|uniref:Polycystic kidney disease protein 1-like 1 n=1 Tax=Cricetulus griseus TaxID=10029 RepID=G3HXX2_CRIGR|nr:Polycystic kidney disease protein 1-like 1 [Cricetulus griseus]